MTHQPNLIPIQPNLAQEERERTSAQLAGVECCPICAAKLIAVTCHVCGDDPQYIQHCPTCSGLGTVKICPNAPHLEV